MAFPAVATVLDDFNRADSPIAGSTASSGLQWIPGYGFYGYGVNPWSIVTNAAIGSPAANGYSVILDESFTGDQNFYAAMNPWVSTVVGNGIGLVYRAPNARGGPSVAVNGYVLFFRVGSGSLEQIDLLRLDNSVFTTIIGVTTFPFTGPGASWGIDVVGDVHTAYYKTPTGAWQVVGSVTDITYSTARYAGLFGTGSTTPSPGVDFLAGGIANAETGYGDGTYGSDTYGVRGASAARLTLTATQIGAPSLRRDISARRQTIQGSVASKISRANKPLAITVGNTISRISRVSKTTAATQSTLATQTIAKVFLIILAVITNTSSSIRRFVSRTSSTVSVVVVSIRRFIPRLLSLISTTVPVALKRATKPLSSTTSTTPVINLTIDDKFNSLDTSIWDQLGVVNIAGTADITPESYSGISDAPAGLRSKLTYNLVDGYVQVEVPQVALGGLTFTALTISPEATSWASSNRIEILYQDTLIFFRHIKNGTNSSQGIGYDATNHRWWRFREANGTFYWDTSADGITWANERSLPTSSVMSLNSVYLTIWSGWVSGAVATRNAIYDNLSLQIAGSSGTTPVIINKKPLITRNALSSQAGSLTRRPNKVILGPSAVSASYNRFVSVSKLAFSTVAGAAAYTKVITFILTASTQTAAQVIKRIGRTLTSASTQAGILSRRIFASRLAPISTASTVGRKIVKTIQANIVGSASYTTRNVVLRVLSTTVGSSVAISRKVLVQLQGAVLLVPIKTVKVARQLAASIASIPNNFKRINLARNVVVGHNSNIISRLAQNVVLLTIASTSATINRVVKIRQDVLVIVNAAALKLSKFELSSSVDSTAFVAIGRVLKVTLDAIIVVGADINKAIQSQISATVANISEFFTNVFTGIGESLGRLFKRTTIETESIQAENATLLTKTQTISTAPVELSAILNTIETTRYVAPWLRLSESKIRVSDIIQQIDTTTAYGIFVQPSVTLSNLHLQNEYLDDNELPSQQLDLSAENKLYLGPDTDKDFATSLKLDDDRLYLVID